MCVMRDRNAYGFKGDTGSGTRGARNGKGRERRRQRDAGMRIGIRICARWPLRALQGPEAELVSCSSLDAGGL